MRKNIWMISFLVLLGINLIFILILASFFNQNYQEVSDETVPAESNELEFILTNSTIETLINENIPYSEFIVNIDASGVAVDIEQTILGFSIHSSVTGEPVVIDDQIVIELTDLNLANLPLSEDALYTAIRSFVDLPPGIALSETERAIVIDVSLFEQYFGVALQVDKIDYENDEWHFSIENIF